MRESKKAKRRRAAAVIDRLEAQMPHAKIELDHRSPLELLISVILSAQCTDKRVNLVTPALFARYRTAAAYASASPEELEQLIKTCGLYRSKAKNIIAAARALVEKHDGKVPITRKELETLPGVGHKTAGVVTNHLGGDPAFPVDTHIRRLAYRLGFTRQTDADQVEVALSHLLPASRWAKAHQLLIWHGRRTCFARSPNCHSCVVARLCPRIGARTVKVRRSAARSAPTSAASFAS
jgi:endonuclease-3